MVASRKRQDLMECMMAKTVRYYTKEDKYMGWEYFISFSQVKSWLSSGNYIEIGNKKYKQKDKSKILELL